MQGERPQLSLVVPAYNENRRLPAYLSRVRPYLDAHYPGDYEVLVVDDGSQDGLGQTLDTLAEGWPQFRHLRHPSNLGKGAAVRTGVLAAEGRLILFTDADGATPIEEERKLQRAIEAGAEVAVGSRLVAGESARRGWLRGLFGRCFARLVAATTGLALRDTQCGFKMFRHEVGRQLFRLSRESGYLFDIEVLARARAVGCRVAEIPVCWADVPGSKVRLLRDAWVMARGLLRLRRALGRSPNRPGRFPTSAQAPACGGLVAGGQP